MPTVELEEHLPNNYTLFQLEIHPEGPQISFLERRAQPKTKLNIKRILILMKNEVKKKI